MPHLPTIRSYLIILVSKNSLSANYFKKNVTAKINNLNPFQCNITNVDNTRVIWYFFPQYGVIQIS